ncbi:MAG TPA: orotate phosphoribosyltransferase [Bryobacteraceae bacterium]|nr:orotate phosphoribosyltransferase [Bryobacteraceae bacterium]
MNNNTERVLELFRQSGAYLEGHFRLTSGMHSPEYMQCALVLQHPQYAEILGQKLASGFRKLEPLRNIDVVVSPAMGGLIIGHEVGRALNARHIFTERVDGKMALRRGFTVKPGDTAVVVEDVITTGGSTLEVVELLKQSSVRVVGAGSIIDRSGGRADVSVPRIALGTMHVVSYGPEQCPLCAQGIPVVKPGSRS